jgi:hypothetical protein
MTFKVIRKKLKYLIEYKYKPYGKKSPMVKKGIVFATDKNDAKEFVKLLEKEEKNWDIETKKLPRKEWF